MVTDEKLSTLNFCVFDFDGGGDDDGDVVATAAAVATALCTGDIRWLLKWYNIIFCLRGERRKNDEFKQFSRLCSFFHSFSLLIYFTCGRYYNIRLQVRFFYHFTSLILLTTIGNSKYTLLQARHVHLHTLASMLSKGETTIASATATTTTTTKTHNVNSSCVSSTGYR